MRCATLRAIERKLRYHRSLLTSTFEICVAYRAALSLTLREGVWEQGSEENV